MTRALVTTLAAIETKVDALIVKRDALKDAAKLALDALVEIRDNGFSWDAEYDKAIAALKAVL